MKRILVSLGIVASAFAVSSDLSTIRSTTISSSCTSSQVAPTAFVYSNVTLNINLAPYESSSSEEFVYEYYTVTDSHEAFETETICSDGNCYVTTIAQSLTTYTTTVDGVLVTIVTAAPVISEHPPLTSHTENIQSVTTSIPTTTPTALTGRSSSSSVLSSDSTEVTSFVTVASYPSDTTQALSSSKATGTTSTKVSSDAIETPSTTVITITSCSDNKCSKIPQTTGLTTITKDSTVYTTYCPLSGKSTSEVATSFYSAQNSIYSVTESRIPTTSIEVSSKESTSSTKTIPTTIITTLECTGGACSKVTHTTGLTVVTDISTVYTTYCPLVEEVSSSTGSTSLSIPSLKSIPTIDVITGNIVTQSVSTVISLSTVATSSVYVVSTYEAGAQSNTLGFTTVVGVFLYYLALL